MDNDSLMVLPRLARPGSFGGLMALYESNYVRLRWLVPDLEALRYPGTRLLSRAPGDFPLYLEVTDAASYTTTMRLTYFLDHGQGMEADPDLLLRIYHDAGQLEALVCSCAPKHEALRTFGQAARTELERRWQRNMMLNKWLEYCADQRHDFGPALAQAWVAGSVGTDRGQLHEAAPGLIGSTDQLLA